MTYANPTALLAEATKEWTPEERQKFNDDFDHFCTYSGFDRLDVWGYEPWSEPASWVKWAFFCGRGK